MSEKISVVGVGKYRKTAENAAVKLEGTPFHFAAMLDVTGPEAYRFTPDRLRLVLHALNPVPRCFIAGEGIDEKDNIAAIEVWKEFVEERKPEHPLMLNFRIVEGKTLEEVLATPKDQLIEEWAGPKMMDHFFPGAGKQYVTGSQAVL